MGQGRGDADLAERVEEESTVVGIGDKCDFQKYSWHGTSPQDSHVEIGGRTGRNAKGVADGLGEHVSQEQLLILGFAKLEDSQRSGRPGRACIGMDAQEEICSPEISQLGTSCQGRATFILPGEEHLHIIFQ